jgi:hypothetical protein
MRVLLDEYVDQRLRRFFDEYDCQSAAYAGLARLTNRVLLLAADQAGFETLISTDQEIPHHILCSFFAPGNTGNVKIRTPQEIACIIPTRVVI